MVTYSVRLDWPAERTPHLVPQKLVEQLVDRKPVIVAGQVVSDGRGSTCAIELCVEGRTPRLAAIHALTVVEPVIETRVTGFRVQDSSRCEQLAAGRDAVPDFVDEQSVQRMLGVDAARVRGFLECSSFPPVVITTPYGDLWDRSEVEEWLHGLVDRSPS